MKRVSAWLPYLVVWWAVLFGVWLVLVDSLAHPEVAVGPIAATLALPVAWGLRRLGGKRFQFRWRWVALLRSVPGSILRDTGALYVVLWRRLVCHEHPNGIFRALQFPTGGGDPESAAWRAFCTVATSLAPNTYVVGIDHERGIILTHQLLPDTPEELRHAVIGAEEPQRPTTA